VKHLAANASLQAAIKNQILIPYHLYQFGNINIKDIHFFWIAKASISKAFKLDEQYSITKQSLEPVAIMLLAQCKRAR